MAEIRLQWVIALSIYHIQNSDSRTTCAHPVQKPDVELGFLRLKVEEVARNKMMKDTWPLLAANKGDIQLTLAFQPIIFDDEDAEEVRSTIHFSFQDLTTTVFNGHR